MDASVKFSINSGDTVYFGGSILDYYCAVQKACLAVLTFWNARVPAKLRLKAPGAFKLGRAKSLELRAGYRRLIRIEQPMSGMNVGWLGPLVGNYLDAGCPTTTSTKFPHL